MPESKTIPAVKAEGLDSKTVYVFVGSHLYLLSGMWKWELQTETFFCSDVILSQGEKNPLPGTPCLIHPDDRGIVEDLIERCRHRITAEFSFRVITTYGTVVTLGGAGVFQCNKDEEFFPSFREEPFHQYIEQRKEELLNEAEQQRLKAYQYSERLTRSGVWYINKSNYQAYYSDGVYAIHGLPPQSLNAHFHTFTSFIHPEDRDIVTTNMEKSYNEEVPLHLEYRLLLNHTEVRYVNQTTRWAYNDEGELVLMGVIEDITEKKSIEQELALAKNDLRINENIILHSESMARTANWQMNLLTRKIWYSEEMHRIYGVKSRSDTLNFNQLIKFVHPEDKALVEETNRLILYEHVAPDIEYRIIRPDGKTRYLRQKGKLLIDDNREMVMIGTVLDITENKVAEAKLKQAKVKQELQQTASELLEEASGTGYWIWDIQTGEVIWSKGIYDLLGYKTRSIQMSQRIFQSFVYPQDKDVFTRAVNLILEGTEDMNLSFRVLLKGEARHLQAHFRLVESDEKKLFIATLHDTHTETILNQELAGEQQLNTVLADASMDRLLATDVHHYITKWNHQCELDYGIKADDAIGKNFFDLFPQLKTPENISHFQKVWKGETVSLREQKALLTGGYQNVMMVPVKDSSESVVGALIMIRDITNEFELRRQLTERLQFIEKLLESIVDRIIVLDKNMNYQYWNKRAEQYYGVAKQEVLGRNILDVFPGFMDDPTYQEFRKALKGEVVHIPANRNLEAKKGYFETYLIPIKNEVQEVTGILWIVHDLIGEFQLAQQQRKANKILDSINEAYIEVDFSGKLRYMNPRAEQLWDCKKEEVLGTNILDVFPEAHDAVPLQALHKSLEERVDVQGEFFAPVSKKWIFLSCTPTSEGVIMLFYDITEIKRSEETNRQSRDLLQSIFNASPHSISAFKAVRSAKGVLLDFELLLSDPLEEKKSGLQLPSSFKKDPFLFEKFKEVVETNIRADFEIHDEASGWYRIIAVKMDDGLLVSLEDINERKDTEEEINKHYQILRQSEDLAQIGSWEFDRATGSFNWSEGMYRISGLPAGTAVQPEVYLDLAVEEDRAMAKKIITHIKQGNSFEEMLRIKSKGAERILKIKGSMVNDEKERPVKMLGIDMDITDMEKAREEIKLHQHLLFQTTMATPDAITVYDLEKKSPVYLNNCLAEWIGHTTEELVAMGIEGRLTFIHPDDRQKLLAFNEQMKLATNGEMHTIEYRIQTRSKKIIWVRNRSKALKLKKDGSVSQILSVLQDFTEEVKLREQLLERSHYAETIIDSSVDRIAVFDRQQRFVAWNKRCSEINHLEKEEVIGKAIAEIFPKVMQDPEYIRAQESALKGEYIHIPSKKDIYTNSWLELFYIPLKNEQGETYAVVNIMHDVTERVNSDQAIRELNRILEKKNRELEQKNEEITHFAFVASHDMKEPLRKIQTFSDWLMQKELKDVSPAAKNYIAKINAAVKRMDLLIEDVLVLTRIHADTIKREKVDLNKILDEVREEMKEQILSAQALVESEALHPIEGNAHQILYLFRNLISNAIKFQKPGNIPKVKIFSEIVEAGSLNSDGSREYLKISFMDNGFGFDKKYEKKIFQVFQRLHGKQEYEGTGMGLAICKKIMENHQGFITVQSKEGEGSTFSCYFPIV